MSVHEINGRVMESVFYRRIAPLLIIFAVLIAVVAAVGTYANNQAITRANTARIKGSETDAVTACENANESREASRKLWYFVVDLASQTAPPERVTYLGEVRDWIGQVYQPHDCQDLSRKYPLPPPPSIPTH